MKIWLLVAVGGAIGALARYIIGGWFQSGNSTFPVGTMSVNIIGSFLLGFIMYFSEYTGVFSDETRIFITIGVLGAFTTMSTFSYESFRMLEHNEFIKLSVNILGTVLLTLCGIYLGKIMAGFAEVFT
ncbi:CrcB protein [Methanolacinia petrolearia DSM 11571]|jgi:CrcB protein|uniref:Fluoride-specific ion channel FluC n=1 Tax=Methanolacinia petrolearia (strain DSM 11571 / OCM 486 / SEBR 4847) TaxID=679926 RepID=E1RIE7_METP4|nr:fluoride efflux transporter CrcB [Methanolacinia petrolearia]ADN35460.1 CrcB protein [Methanolacinia petrolearia DSM 11571]